jgi:hypothetical protein
MRKLFVSALVVCVCLAGTASAQQPRTDGARVHGAPVDQHRVNPVGTANAAFQKRLHDYLQLRAELTKKIPEVKETGDPKKISAREKALGEAIAAARKDAKPGDLFGPDMTPIYTQIVTADWKRRSPADRKAMFNELPQGTHIRINEPYPTTLPLLTVPSNLLVNLPMLPDDLEYRIIDRHLLLRDRDANMVLDVLFNIVPKVE